MSAIVRRTAPMYKTKILGSAAPAETLRAEKFGSAEQAWFWTMGALAARRDGTTPRGGSVPRPCDPDDIIRCIDQLYRRRRIDLVHARVMRIWGERCVAPNPECDREKNDSRIWCEAMDRLAWPLRVKGIVG